MSSESNCNDACGRVCCQGEDCEDVCCRETCLDPCSNSCDTACSNACNQCTGQCGDSCSNSCNESCSGSNCCSSSSATGASPGFIGMITFFTVILCNIIVGIFDAFNSQGPILITLFGSMFLAANLTGISFISAKKGKKIPLCKTKTTDVVSTKWGRLLVNHSHHTLAQCETGHEFKLGGKYFCTGCYGILLGSTVAILFFLTYLFDTVDYSFIISYSFIIPLCFIPILLRYTVNPRMGTPLRFVANALIPVGCSLLFIACDIMYYNWFINVGMILFILLVAFMRGMVAARNNK